MIQPILLQAFASTPLRMAALQRASSTGECPNCGQVGCVCAVTAPAEIATQPVDELELSDEGLAAAQQDAMRGPQTPATGDGANAAGAPTQGDSQTSEASEGEANEPNNGGPATAEEPRDSETELTEEEAAELTELRSRDREVRAHEQAHIAAAGPYAQGGPSYEYQEGPDGNRYAIGGEVGIDVSPIPGDPEATVDKAQQVRAAALAPATPSSQDQRVAAAATQMATEARIELAEQNRAQQYAAASYGTAEKTGITGALLDLVA